MAMAFHTLSKAWPMAVVRSTVVSLLMHLLMGGIDQPGKQHDDLLKAQLLVLVCVQVLHDVIYFIFFSILTLWVEKIQRLGLDVARDRD